MEDRVRLFKLIQIIQSVQSDGIYCQHGVSAAETNAPSGEQALKGTSRIEREPFAAQNDSIANAINQADVGKRSRIDENRNKISLKEPSGVPQRNVAFEVNGNVVAPLPYVQAKPYVKTIGNGVTVKYDRIAGNGPKPTGLADSKAPQRTSESDSPMFKCRKALNFSDPDIYSDEESKTAVAAVRPAQFKPSEISSSASVSAATPTENTVKSIAVITTTQSDVTKAVSSGTASSVATSNLGLTSTKIVVSKPNGLIPNDGAAHTMPGVASLKPPKIVSKEFVSSPQLFIVNANQNGSHGVTQHPQRLVLNGRTMAAPSFTQTIHSYTHDNGSHAYFPDQLDSAAAAKQPHVEQIFHNSGYNYGVPDASPIHPTPRAFACGSDGDNTGGLLTRLCPEKIRVCVRKRPRNAREIKRNELDIVKVRDKRTVIVDELKVAVDLTKFIQQVCLINLWRRLRRVSRMFKKKILYNWTAMCNWSLIEQRQCRYL